MRLTRADGVRLLLLWLGGVDLRLTLLAVPPLIPNIHHDLHLDEKAVGALVALPILLLATAAVPGSLLIARLGLRSALAIGLGAIAIFGATRGAGSTVVLFGSTLLMGVGVAVSQPAFPALVREWFPTRIALATALFSNGILIGETIPTVLTTPVGVLPLAHGDWRFALPVWSICVLVTGAGIALYAPARQLLRSGRARWWPSWLEGQTVRIGLVMGMASTVYFGSNAYIPDFLDQSGRHSLITPTLAVLNASQLLTAPVVAMWDRLLTGRVGFLGSAGLLLVAQIGVVLAPGAGVVLFAFLLGFSAALGFIVVLTLPPRLAAAGDVHRMSAGIFTIQYASAFVIPLLAGALWDATGVSWLAFVPGMICAGAMAWLAWPLQIRQ
ncbi:MAG TPA: MFS transporter [Candidatus Dormibacteraeota bacterium]|nr:MFS transporter [Candidatus Dormibacteraeota bacterium]